MSVRRVRARWCVVFAVAALGLTGCGGPKVHEVRGKVVLADGDAAQLAGRHIEFEREGDGVRADGLIDEAGRFELQTMHQGKLYKGALEGKYRARLILDDGEDGTDDDDQPKKRRRKKQPVHERFLSFEKSGLSYQVPAEGEITVSVSAK